MHCNSKLSKVDEKIEFLERKLLEHSQLIDELTTDFYKLKFLPSKNSKQKWGQDDFQGYIKKDKATVEETGNDDKECNISLGENNIASYSATSVRPKVLNKFAEDKYAPEKINLSTCLIPVIPKNFNEPRKFLSVPLYKPASTEAPPQEHGRGSHLEPWQFRTLIAFFDEISQSPTKEDIKKLSQKVERTQSCVKMWFYNRRRSLNQDKKRAPKLIDHEQFKTLETYFDRNQNPSVEEIEKLSEDLKLSVIRVNRWFYSRRYKAKKDLKNNSLISKRKKKVSNRRSLNYTEEEKKDLEAEYEKNKHPSLEDKQLISERLGLDVLRVHFWFQSRRSKRYSSKDADSSRTEPGPSSSSMMNKLLLDNPTKDTTSRARLFNLSKDNFNQSEEQLVSSYRHESVTDQKHFLPRQQTIMSNSGNEALFGGKNDLRLSQSNYKNKQSYNVSNELFDLNNLTEETPSSSYLNEYNDEEDLDDLIGETSLFSELFDEPNSSLRQEENDYMQYINMKMF